MAREFVTETTSFESVQQLPAGNYEVDTFHAVTITEDENGRSFQTTQTHRVYAITED